MLPLLEALEPCQRILIAGAGGGFDVVAGVPLYEYLRAQGKQVWLASLSFSELSKARGRKRGTYILEVDADSGGDEDYFPERYLSEWFWLGGESVPVYCYKAAGPMVMLEIYQQMVRDFQLDGLILVDGGTDILMRGDEPALGTPLEDMCSLAAAEMLEVAHKFVVCLGFGVDAFHEVCHHYVLEAIADLNRHGDYLGALSLTGDMPEFQALTEAVEYVCSRTPGKESIVMTSVVAAGRGNFGNFHPTVRTSESQLFLNPLMSMYFCFRLDGLARRCLYLDYLKAKYGRWEVHRGICNFLSTITPREWKRLPL
ncbi:MAG: DUF1152 domain-containing protein [Candidatus Eremiobacteraeota bacterium]|nr:DUF1152 domain-containing protein [Candidatus Eremiobacteraeota bacterium]